MSHKTFKGKLIKLSPHAKEKLERLTQLGITEEKAVETILTPSSLSSGYLGRKVAQSALTDKLLLRVVYEETDNSILVVTLYPAKRQRYE